MYATLAEIINNIKIIKCTDSGKRHTVKGRKKVRRRRKKGVKGERSSARSLWHRSNRQLAARKKKKEKNKPSVHRGTDPGSSGSGGGSRDVVVPKHDDGDDDARLCLPVRECTATKSGKFSKPHQLVAFQNKQQQLQI